MPRHDVYLFVCVPRSRINKLSSSCNNITTVRVSVSVAVTASPGCGSETDPSPGEENVRGSTGSHSPDTGQITAGRQVVKQNASACPQDSGENPYLTSGCYLTGVRGVTPRTPPDIKMSGTSDPASSNPRMWNLGRGSE